MVIGVRKGYVQLPELDHDGETYYIEDLNSTNGTFVNDEPLAYKERRKLNSNDMIRFADVRYRFC